MEAEATVAHKLKGMIFNVKPKTEDQRCRSEYSPLDQMLGDLRRRNRLAMPKTVCASDTSSLKPGLGASEGVLDEGVL